MKPPNFSIRAAVKFNKSFALVLNRAPEFKYVKEGLWLKARDNFLYNFYRYEAPSAGFQAFAGREFSIPMENGTRVRARGQWWDDCPNDKPYIQFIYSTEEELKKCYVFGACYATKDEANDLFRLYQGPIYEYEEYEKELKNS